MSDTRPWTTIGTSRVFSDQIGIISNLLDTSKTDILERSFQVFVSSLIEAEELPPEWDELKITEAQKKKLFSKGNESDIPDGAIVHAISYIQKAAVGKYVHPSVLRYADDNISCAVARLHCGVVNGFGSNGAPNKRMLKGISFLISMNEVEGVGEYLKYFKKEVSTLKKLTTYPRIFDLAKDLEVMLNKK